MRSDTTATLCRSLILFLSSLMFSVTGYAESGLPQPLAAIAGDWQGMVHCYGYNIMFELRLEGRDNGQLGGELEATAQMMDSGARNRPKQKFTLGVQGNYDPALAMFTLQTVNAPHTQRFDFRGVLEPNSERLAALVKSPYYNTCSYAIAGKPEIKRTLKNIVSGTDFTPKTYRSKNFQECDDEVMQWLAQAETLPPQTARGQEKYAALWLLENQRFETYFGDSFADLSRGEAAKLAFQLSRGCQQRLARDRVKTPIAHLVSRALMNSADISRGEVFIYPVAAQILRDWKAQAAASIPAMTGVNERLWMSKAAQAQAVTAILWPEGEMGLDKEIMAVRQQARGERLLTDVQRQIDTGRKDFGHLLRLSEYPLTATAAPVSRRQQQRLARAGRVNPAPSAESRDAAAKLIAQAINEHIIPAARAMAAAAKSPQDIDARLQPLRVNTQFASLTRYVEADNISQVDEIFRLRQQELITGFAASESAAFAADQARAAGGLNDLAQAVALEAQLRERYGRLLNDAAFSEFNQIRETQRRALLAAHQGTLSEQIAQAEMATQIDDLLVQYLFDADRQTAAGQALLTAQSQRRRVVAPFSGLAGGDYLNAIYQGDIKELRRLDEAYIASLRPLIDQSMAMTKQMAPLLAMFSGGMMSAESINQRIDDGMENLTLFHRVLATYLFNYDRQYGACLRDPHVLFTVTTTTPDIVTRDGLGWEVAREYGSTTQTEYKVNTEFSDAFHYIGTSGEGMGSGALLDGFMNQGKITRLLTGTKQMMGKFACDSPEIQRMEKSLVWLFGRLK